MRPGFNEVEVGMILIHIRDIAAEAASWIAAGDDGTKLYRAFNEIESAADAIESRLCEMLRITDDERHTLVETASSPIYNEGGFDTA